MLDVRAVCPAVASDVHVERCFVMYVDRCCGSGVTQDDDGCGRKKEAREVEGGRDFIEAV